MSQPYTPTPNGKAILGDDVQGIINGITGVTPHIHRFNNDTSSHAVTIQNTDTADGGNHLRVLHSNTAAVLFEVTDDGVSFESTALTDLDLPGTLGVAGASTLGATALSGTFTLPGPTAGDHTASKGLSVIEDVVGTPTWGLPRFFTPEMFGAVRDGVTDDGPALQRAINAAKAVAGIVQLSQGRYRSNQALRCNSATGIVIRGPSDATIGSARCMIRFSGAAVSGAAERNHLMEFVGTKSVTLEGFCVSGDTTDAFDPVGWSGISNSGIATCIFFGPTDQQRTGTGDNELSGEGIQHVIMRRITASGPVKVAAVAIWSAFYVTIENCGLFTNGTVNSNAALRLMSANAAGLFSTDTALSGGSTSGAGTIDTAQHIYNNTHIDGMRQVSIRQSLISAQSVGSNTYGIYLDTVRHVTVQDCEPTTSTASPSIIISDAYVTKGVSEGITLDHCQMGSGPGSTSAAIKMVSSGVLNGLRVIDCCSGNLEGPLVESSLDGGGFRRLVISGYNGIGGTVPAYIVKVASSTNANVLRDCEIHATVRSVLSESARPIDVGSGAIGGSTKIYGAGTITAGGGCRAELNP